MIHLTPEQKARSLVSMFISDGLIDKHMGIQSAKACARMVVLEIIESRKGDERFDDRLSADGSEYYTPHPMYATYWILTLKAIDTLECKQ